MPQNPVLRHLRDLAAVLTVGLFMFPLFWWGLNSIKPASAIFENFSVTWFDFTPTLDNYRVTLAGEGPAFFAARQAIFDTILVSVGATLLTLAAALPAESWSAKVLPVRFSIAISVSPCASPPTPVEPSSETATAAAELV